MVLQYLQSKFDLFVNDKSNLDCKDNHFFLDRIIKTALVLSISANYLIPIYCSSIRLNLI